MCFLEWLQADTHDAKRIRTANLIPDAFGKADSFSGAILRTDIAWVISALFTVHCIPDEQQQRLVT